jgi:hypothetical protein
LGIYSAARTVDEKVVQLAEMMVVEKAGERVEMKVA